MECILIAWAYGELSEGQACKLLCMDRVAARVLLDEVLGLASELWETWGRKNNPAQYTEAHDG